MLIHTLLVSIKLCSSLKKSLIDEIRKNLLTPSPDSLVHENIAKIIRDSGIVDDVAFKENLAKADQFIQELSEKNIRIITIRDDDYPIRFKPSLDAPLILFAKGNIKALNSEKTFGVIGKRSADEAICNKGVELSAQLSEKGYMIVSGLAQGCDTAGHIGCLEAEGITTAILPSSIERVYPAANRPLAERIVNNNGCLVSEYLPNQKMQRYYFLQRDRLQAALSDALLALQTGIGGGTIHTVNYALQYIKPVYCYLSAIAHKNINLEGNRLLVAGKKAIPIESVTDL